VGQLKRRKCRLKKHMTSTKGAKKRKNHSQLKNKNMWTIPTTKVEHSKMQPLKVEPHIELVEKEVRTKDLEVGTEPLVAIQVETTKTIMEQPKA
jgi:hypothetical protein